MRYKSPFADYFKEPKEEKPKPPKPPKVKREIYRFELVCDKIADREIVEKMESVPNRCEYIRRLVREDVKRTK